MHLTRIGWPTWATVILGLAAGASASLALADEPCCHIAAIDARAGLVTVQEKATGRTFRCKVADATRLKHLRVGHPVRQNYFHGKFLGAGDLTQEQEYHRDQRRLHPPKPTLDRPADCPPELTQRCPPRCP